jgi:hypothetical protein
MRHPLFRLGFVLRHHGTNYYGEWFQDSETPEGFTEKVPPNTGYIFDEAMNGWVPKPEPIESESDPTETKTTMVEPA